MSLTRIPGARFSHVVVKIDAKVTRTAYKFEKDKKGMQHLVPYEKEQDGGFMVYFPRGHAIRIPNEEMLKHYGLHREPRIINMSGLHDPNSPVGKMLLAQDQETRDAGYEDLKKMVVRLATARSGNVLMPEQLEEGV